MSEALMNLDTQWGGERRGHIIIQKIKTLGTFKKPITFSKNLIRHQLQTLQKLIAPIKHLMKLISLAPLK